MSTRDVRTWSFRVLISGAAGLSMALFLQQSPRPEPSSATAPGEWVLPALPERADATAMALEINARQNWGGNRSLAEAQSESEMVRQAELEAERARRAAHRWRFVGSIQRNDRLQALFQSGDARKRWLVPGEALEGGARLLRLEPGLAEVEIPARFRAQNDIENDDGPISLQLLRNTEFALYSVESIQEGAEQGLESQFR